MNRFRTMLSTKRDAGAFIPFFMLGDPSIDQSFELICAAIQAGADGLELGIPFSDPIADGPVIQASAIRAAQAGATVDRCFDLIARIRRDFDIPIGLLVYYNLIHRRGLNNFCERAAACGVDALLAADLPFGQHDRFADAVAACGLGSVYLVSQNTPDERARRILEASTAYTYAVGVMGTTGQRESLSEETRGFVRRLRALSDAPFVVGFGVGTPPHAVDILRHGADGVIAGSALIRRIAENPDRFDTVIENVRTFVSDVRTLRERNACSS